MTRIAIFAAAALIALGGCDDRGGTGKDRANAATGGGSAAEAGSNRGQGEEAGSTRVLLEPDAVIAGGTEEGRIPFGTGADQAIERLTPLLGADIERNSSDECGAGPMQFANWGEVALNFQEGRLVGWSLRVASQAPWIGTPGGATIGTPRSELGSALAGPLTVEETSLGTEFSAGGLSGLLSGPGPNATVTDLWAGTNCIMR